MTHWTIGHLQAWRREHAATLGVGVMQMRTADRRAVLLVDSDQVVFLTRSARGNLWDVWYRRWHWEHAAWETSWVGELSVEASSTDELYQLIDAPCPRCGGSGEIPHHTTLESGHSLNDPLPCPVCGESIPL